MEDSHSQQQQLHSTSEQQLRDGTNSSGGFRHNAAGSNGGAKYKLMTPAMLPISRSACITIPPGLSPSSFLESPVLLSNIKVSSQSLFLCYF